MAQSLRITEHCFQLLSKLPRAPATILRSRPPAPIGCLNGGCSPAPRQLFSARQLSIANDALQCRLRRQQQTSGNARQSWPPVRSITRAPSAQLAVATELAASPAETETKGESVLLDVSGMMCGGCAASVRRTLASDTRVASAAVNLLTHTAAVQLRPGLALETGQALAEALSKSGFATTVRQFGDALAATNQREALARQREESLRDTTVQLGVAWGLVAVCLAHHTGHLLHGLGFHQFAHGGTFDHYCLLLISMSRVPSSQGSCNNLMPLGHVQYSALSLWVV